MEILCKSPPDTSSMHTKGSLQNDIARLLSPQDNKTYITLYQFITVIYHSFNSIPYHPFTS